MEEDLLARLRTRLSGVVGTRNSRAAIDWVERGETLPCLTLQDFAPGREYTFSGARNYFGTSVQFDCWAKTYGEAKLIERALIAEMEQARTVGDTRFNVSFLTDSRAMKPEDLGSGIKVFRQSLDFTVWHGPA